MNLLRIFCISQLAAASALCLRAEDEPPDADLPQPFDASVADALLENPPFTRALNLSDSLTLTGIAYVDGRPVATLLDRATKQSYIVSEEPNALGWKLADASPDAELRHTQVRIMVGPEIVTVRYGIEQITPGHAKKGSTPGGGPMMTSRIETRTDRPVKTSSYLGENGRERYAMLSDKSRDKLKETLQRVFEKNPGMTMEARSSYAQKMFAKTLAEDQKPAASDAVQKAPKPQKISKNNRAQ